MTRDDILHLSPEALTQHANAGLVKRALREIESGYRPTLQLDAAATLTATFADGVVTVWRAAAPLRDVLCNCGAVGICRHRIIAALVYRESAQRPPVLSPGTVSDDTLTEFIAARVLAAARSERAHGLLVEVRRESSGEPCPTARLPHASVRFWGGAALPAARCDCAMSVGCQHVALAVWAFRQADADGAEAPVQQVRIGATSGTTATLDRAPLHQAVATLCRYGVMHGGSAHAQAMSGALAAVDAAGAVWLRLLLDDLDQWHGSYAARRASYDPHRGVQLLAELGQRLAAGGQPGQVKPAWGVGEAREVELDRLRLMSLGCWIDADGEQRTARVILADTDTSTRFVLHHSWQAPSAGDEAALRDQQRVAAGVKLTGLAAGQLLSQQARRVADGTLRLRTSRSAYNHLLPQNGDWSTLGPPTRCRDLGELLAERRHHPLAARLPRHAAGQFLVLGVKHVDQVFYDPQEQALYAWLLDQAPSNADDAEAFDEPEDVEEVDESDANEGAGLLLRLPFRPHVRHALDAAAGALSGRFGPVRHIAGLVVAQAHGLMFEPWAFACDRLVVPDIEPPCGALSAIRVDAAEWSATAPAHQAMLTLHGLLVDILQRGAVHTPNCLQRLAVAAAGLREQSLTALANATAAVVEQWREHLAGSGSVAAEPLLHLAALLDLHLTAVSLQAGQ